MQDLSEDKAKEHCSVIRSCRNLRWPRPCPGREPGGAPPWQPDCAQVPRLEEPKLGSTPKMDNTPTAYYVMYMYVNEAWAAYIYIYIICHPSVYIYIYVCVYIYICMYIQVCVCIYTYIYIYIHVYIYIYIYILYAYARTHTHSLT